MTYVSIRVKRTKPHTHKYLSNIYLLIQISRFPHFFILASEKLETHDDLFDDALSDVRPTKDARPRRDARPCVSTRWVSKTIELYYHT